MDTPQASGGHSHSKGSKSPVGYLAQGYNEGNERVVLYQLGLSPASLLVMVSLQGLRRLENLLN